MTAKRVIVGNSWPHDRIKGPAAAMGTCACALLELPPRCTPHMGLLTMRLTTAAGATTCVEDWHTTEHAGRGAAPLRWSLLQLFARCNLSRTS